MALAEGVQSQLVCDLSCVHGIGKILLVGEHQQHSVTQLILQNEGSRSDTRARHLPIHHAAAHHAEPDTFSITDIRCMHYSTANCHIRVARVRTSLSIRCSSSRASPMRSRSLLSTTKMRPWVFWK